MFLLALTSTMLYAGVLLIFWASIIFSALPTQFSETKRFIYDREIFNLYII